MTIGGNVCVRNGIDLDYCWREAVESLLQVCDTVVICDAQSTDGTWEEVQEWARIEPKIATCVYEWKNPVGDIDFWVNWINYARIHIRCDWHLQLDADEVLHEDSYPIIREFVKHGKRAAVCARWNFFGDHQHVIPEGECIGKHVKRLAPQEVWMPSDGWHVKASEICSLETPTDIAIFHYGFLRRPEAFFKKEHALQNYFFGACDPRIKQVEDEGGDWMKNPCLPEWCSRLVPSTLSHPAVAVKWLNDRGYKC